MPDVLDRLKAALAGRYAVEGELGSGGMAVVFLAQDLRHERPVAVKVLRPELTSVVTAERFLQEIKITAGLTHPHILPVLDSGEADGLLYYVMPFVEGESLRERLIREKRVPVDESVRIAREVADALSHAHDRKLLHRDIKPENILLEAGHAVVADFGIAKALSDAAGDRLTDTGVTIGTPAYMSPEQAAGEREIGEGSDLYSLACVLYRMLTGEPPIAETSVQKIVSRKLLGDFRPAREVCREVPVEVDAAVAKALATAPEDRFSSAEEFTEALDASGGRASYRRSPWLGRTPMARRVRTGSLAVVVLLAAALGYWFFGLRESSSTLDRKSIAVLPLENLSGEEASEPFTNGIHDDILTHLYKIGDLKVISRTSVMEYRDTKKNLRQIADELGVATVLEGGVQRSGNRVRINVQLIDAETDEHLWAETYEEDLTAQNIFTIQTDIAERIARALRAQLSTSEREHLTYQPTQSVEAYDAYLTAREYQRRWRAADEDRRIAVQLFETAIELDANFALAYADLSAFQSKVCWIYGCRSERLARAKELAETALGLEPDLAQAHIALGNYHYYASVDYVGAVEEYNRAIKLAPNNGNAYSQLTAVQARAGDPDASLVSARKAAELSPRSSDTFDLLGYIQMWLRNYEAAAQSYDRAIALAPDVTFSYVWKAWASLNQRGGERQASEAWAQLQEVTGKSLAPFSAMFYGRAVLRTFGESLQEAVRAQIPAWAGDTISVLLSGAIIYDAAGESESARVLYDSARVYLEGRPAGLGPEYRHSALGIAYAGLGRVDESIREARMAVELLPVSNDALEGPWFVAALAEVYVMVGKVDDTIDQLEYLLSIDCPISPPLLRADPLWDPLRDHPRFQALLEKYE